MFLFDWHLFPDVYSFSWNYLFLFLFVCLFLCNKATIWPQDNLSNLRHPDLLIIVAVEELLFLSTIAGAFD